MSLTRIMKGGITLKSLFKLLISLLVKLAFIALIYTIVMNLTGCAKNDRPLLLTVSSEESQEFEVCTRPSKDSIVTETTKSTEPSLTEGNETCSETKPETKVTKPKQAEKKAQAKKVFKAPTKAPKKASAKKAAVKNNETKESTTKTTTTRTVTKTPTKKPTNTPTPKPYTHCTCDAEVSCGSTAAGTFHKFTLKGLTAYRTKSGNWALTEASEDKVVRYLKENYPGYGGYGVGKLKNKRDYRYKP